MWTVDLVGGQAVLAGAVRVGGQEHNLVTRLPAPARGLLDHPGAVGADDARRIDALHSVRHPEVEVIEPRGLDGDRHVAFEEGLSGPVAKPDAGGSQGLLVLRREALAADPHARCYSSRANSGGGFRGRAR